MITESLLNIKNDPVLPIGLGNIRWHNFRHSVSSWGKASLKLEETKALLRRASLATTSEVSGGMDMKTKRAAQQQSVTFIKCGGLPEGIAETHINEGSQTIH